MHRISLAGSMGLSDERWRAFCVDYDIDLKSGFVTANPCTRLTEAPYALWESAMDSMRPLLLAGKFRQRMDIVRQLLPIYNLNVQMPVVSIDMLRNDRERRRAYVILSMLAHAYVWGLADFQSSSSMEHVANVSKV